MGTSKIKFAKLKILVLNEYPINMILLGPKIRAIRGPPVFGFLVRNVSGELA